jgi:hypothetical protein
MAEQKEAIENQIPEVFKDLMSQNEWDKLSEVDPSIKLYGASGWQTTYNALVFSEDASAESSPFEGEAKGSKVGWRDLQDKCYEKYRSFGPLNAAINSKADYTAGAGFDLYSPNYKIHEFVRELWYSHRNQMYTRVVGFMIRMLAEGELFLLLSFDEEGRAKVRVLEPSRVGRGGKSGLILNPHDATETLFYKYKKEYIPDINIAYHPEKYALVKNDVTREQIKNSKAVGTKQRGFKKSLGGFNRFVIHWKNLTGIMEYERDTSSLSTILEAINLYWNAIKWQLDHKKAQAAYTNIFSFDDTVTGKLAFHMFKKMSPEERAKSGLTGRLKPGARVFCMPGLSFDVKNPQLSKIDGDNRDLLNIAGAGAQTPQDMFQGQSSDTSHAALKSSRSPLEKEIENLQFKLANFTKYSLLRSCFYVANQLGKFPDSFKTKAVDRSEGEPKIIDASVEPCELVEVILPHVKFESELQGKAAAYYGNNHEGATAHGISEERAAKSLGINDYNREQDVKFLETGGKTPPVEKPVETKPAKEEDTKPAKTEEVPLEEK